MNHAQRDGLLIAILGNQSVIMAALAHITPESVSDKLREQVKKITEVVEEEIRFKRGSK